VPWWQGAHLTWFQLAIILNYLRYDYSLKLLLSPKCYSNCMPLWVIQYTLLLSHVLNIKGKYLYFKTSLLDNFCGTVVLQFSLG
jgi:hypothetical protein